MSDINLIAELSAIRGLVYRIDPDMAEEPDTFLCEIAERLAALVASVATAKPEAAGPRPLDELLAEDADTTTRLAVAFSAAVRKNLAPHLAEINRRNATAKYHDSGSCATHDFCDANMLMLAAMEARGLEWNPADESLMATINAAWGAASEAGFAMGMGE